MPDSTDAELIVTTEAVWDSASAWTVERDPVMRVGLRDGDAPYLFQGVVGVELLQDGRVAVADALSREIRFFDEQGTHLRTFGRVGQGPGEFEDVSWMSRCGVGLLVLDLRLARATVVNLDGELEETFPLRDLTPDRRPYRLACGPDGQLVFVGWGEMTGPDEFQTFSNEALLRLWDRGSGRMADLGQYVAAERLRVGRGTWPHPFGRAVVFALSRDRVFIGRSERLQIEVRDFEGTLTHIFRGPDVDLSLSPAWLEQYESAEVARPDSLLRQLLAAEGVSMPDSVPAYRHILIDSLSSLWLERFAGPFAIAPSEWGVFSNEGVFLGHVTMPENFRLLDVTDDLLAGVTTDELGVQRIELYRIARN